MSAVKPSLRSRLLWHVVLALAVTWALGSLLVIGVASYFLGLAFDRSLLDDAHALAAHVRLENDRLVFDLSPTEMQMVLFDQRDTLYFAIFGPDGALVAGHAGLRPTPLSADQDHDFANVRLHGRTLHAVSLRRHRPFLFTVVMAQTTASRSELLQRLLTYSVVPQLLLLIFLAWWLRRIIGRDLQPLSELQAVVNQRDASDLMPVPQELSEDAGSRDVQRLGSAINSLLARLGASLQAQREFTGNVAHELRTPLAGIRAQVGFALAQNAPEIWREQLQGIARSEARASHQVDQLLALARADEASGILTPVPVALDVLVRDLLIRYLPRADAAGIDLGALGLDSRHTVWADTALVEGMLTNLLDNALRYGRAAVQPQVTVALERLHSGIALSVTDNGPGLSQDEVHQLLRRGAQGVAGRQLGTGAGLGLAIVGRYAELLGASLALMPAADGPGLCAQVLFKPAPDITDLNHA
ncbi:MAG: sensor histidine kinase N-terminal domain-containing protein [Burkholderiaceae bacterium]|nr:sensor histidine kinase N-terminal domain-containing protein [Burkholderiaceae bacterium]